MVSGRRGVHHLTSVTIGGSDGEMVRSRNPGTELGVCHLTSVTIGGSDGEMVR